LQYGYQVGTIIPHKLTETKMPEDESSALNDLAKAASEQSRTSVSPRQPRVGLIKRYRRRCGFRSFVFQAIFAGWSVAIAIWMIVPVLSVIDESHQPWPTSNSPGAVLLGAWACIIAGWALIAVPLGIAALATYEGNA